MSDTATIAPEEEAVETEPVTATDGDGGEGGDDTTTAVDTEEEGEDKDRRPRGWLESDVKAITDKYVTGEIKIEEDKPLTPHRLARLVKEEGQLESIPSTGAVAAVLKRWIDLGFAKVSEKPFAFIDYTDEGRSVGLKGLKERRGEARKAERAAAKATEAPAESGDAAATAGGDQG